MKSTDSLQMFLELLVIFRIFLTSASESPEDFRKNDLPIILP